MASRTRQRRPSTSLITPERLRTIVQDAQSEKALTSYARSLRTLNRTSSRFEGLSDHDRAGDCGFLCFESLRRQASPAVIDNPAELVYPAAIERQLVEVGEPAVSAGREIREDMLDRAAGYPELLA